MDAAALVVGGGPVGAALGLLIPGALVLDRSAFPRDKACGEGLMPAGAAVLRAAGVDLEAEGFPVIEGVRYRTAAGLTARGAFRGRPGFGVRRLRLDALLAERAGVRTGVRVTSVRPLPDRVEAETTAGRLVAPFLVAADGLASPVAHLLGWWRPPRGLRYAVVGHLEARPPGPDVEVTLLGDVETYTAPVGEHETLVAVLGPRGAVRAVGLSVEETWRSFVERAHGALANAPLAGGLRGAGPFGTRPSRVAGGRVFLAGDAAGFADPLTGDAISAGLEQARLLADLVARRTEMAEVESRYRRRLAAQWRRRAVVTACALLLSRSARLGPRAVAGMARRPLALERFMAVNEGSRPLGALGPRDWAALAGF
ncbi:MAG: NAD(P)/FAD-dependent oxidoreductase [Candidatus Dormibacterales bacterium]